ncbi:MAG: 5'-nucleotidase C-terminal domain-containing protein [Aeromicrobium erythreum]
MKTRQGRLVAAVCTVAVAAATLVAAPAQAADPVTINLLGINDFHGRIDSNTVKFAGTVEQLRAEAGDADTLLVSAGDNVSASLFPSAVQGDVPTIDVLNALDLGASAAGNHEFDKGYDDLVGRIQPKADFPILGANVRKADGSRALDAYKIFDVDGVSVAVVGAVTQETPSLVSPDGVKGLTFGDPAASINEAVDELEKLPSPPKVIVASFHEGAPDGSQTFQQAVASSTVFRNLVENTSPEVDAIFMGHTHQTYAYDAPVPGDSGRTRPVVQTGSYGANVGQVKLTVDPDSGDVTAHTQRNVARTTTADDTLVAQYPRVKAVDTIVDAALAYADKVGSEPKGRITADITRAFANGTEDRGAESTLGSLVADSMLAKVGETTAGADLAVTNPGGLRADLTYAGTGGANADGVVTYAEANAVLPFVNNLSSVSLSGASLKKVLEQQWQRDAAGNVPSRAYLQLGVSKNVRYTFDATRPEGDRITSVTIDGKPLDAAATYKVAVPSFLASGGDNFRAFTEGKAVDTGLVDYEAWISYLEANDPTSPDFGRRSLAVEGLKDAYTEGDQVSFKLPKLDLTSKGAPASTRGTVTLVQGDAEKTLGEFTVTNGSATPTVTLPKGVTGSARLRVDVQPTGTKVLLPPITIAQGKADTRVDAATLPFLPRGAWTFVAARVSGGEQRPTGTVSVSEGDTRLGTGRLVGGYVVVAVDARLLASGRHTWTVTYGGDDTHAGSTDTVTTTIVGRR